MSIPLPQSCSFYTHDRIFNDVYFWVNLKEFFNHNNEFTVKLEIREIVNDEICDQVKLIRTCTGGDFEYSHVGSYFMGRLYLNFHDNLNNEEIYLALCNCGFVLCDGSTENFLPFARSLFNESSDFFGYWG